MTQISDADQLRNWKSPIDGYEIMEYFQIEPSSVIREIKDVVKESVLDGRIPYNHEAAWQLVLEIAPQFGLHRNNMEESRPDKEPTSAPS